MVKSKLKENLFILSVSFLMSFGMESYNLLLQGYDFNYHLLTYVMSEVWYITIIVFVISKYFGLILSRRLYTFLFTVKPKNEYKIILFRTLCTVSVMSPTMSLVASFLFKDASVDNFFKIWIVTTAFNFPVAFIYQIIFVGPIVKCVMNKCFN